MCVFGCVVDCPLALSGACAHSAWHPAYSAPHTDPPTTTHHGQHTNKQSTVTQTFLTQKEAAPLMLLTIMPHRADRLTNIGAEPEHHTVT